MALRRPAWLTRRRALLVCVIALLGVLSACSSTRYYAQAVGGHLELLSKTRPVDTVIADPATPPAVVRKLQLARDMRQFASRELGLPDNDSYKRYADLGRPYAVWNVVSTPELSLTPRASCFFFVGCISYRGFFSEHDARDFAAARSAAGDDVYVYGVPAYSTLGWLSDPLLNTFLGYSDTDLARLIFHELAHQLVYVDGDSAFNEAFATSVEIEGARRWRLVHGDAAPERETTSQQRREQFQHLLAHTQHQLTEIYTGPASDADKRTRKHLALQQLLHDYQALKQQWGGYRGYDHWFDPPPGNAHLASLATYHNRVPAFSQLLHEQSDELPKFYAAVRELAKLPTAERNARLDALQQRGASTPAATQ
ncbi:Predicted aminopeptidase [Andreprevotia lacus DSM 23236]|jgi:predicted aminopeptidase|uniref:Predicted aminopeptidase n=1 Tax=Andreprevotia lacus DSM 23236 TaxID=1121001 RepID=A0A1W1X2B4_9NEIS|nr:aminopeptidase [Andreprevotia lacus]SMC18082.1 Predicted aminopeptidase [Andreprevotia lacus DSM 23236]